MDRYRIYKQQCAHCKKSFKTTIYKLQANEGRFCSRSCSASHRKGVFGAHWKGGRNYDKQGYILLKMPGHPKANNSGYVREHVLMAEKHLNRQLLPNEVVHHKNGKKDDNRLENLSIMTFSEHCLLHYKLRKINKIGRLI